MSKELAAMYLEAVAAKAKALAHDVRTGRTRPGDAARIIADIHQDLRSAIGQIGEDR